MPEERSASRSPADRASARPVLRGDAARNRQRIIDAACRLIRRHGLDVPLEEIAREAEVGIATLYRRFPTRADLVAAAFEAKIADYREVVEQAGRNPDPWGQVEGLVRGLCELQADDAGLRDMLTMEFPDTPEVEALRRQVAGGMQEVIEQARRAGVVRDDLRATDLALLLLGNAGVVVKTRERSPDAWRRYVDLTLAALRPPAVGDAPGK